MSKKLINQDAAYALGEEAFRAGFAAGYAFIRRQGASLDEVIKGEHDAWDAFEPSEEVKALIGEG